MPYMYKIPEQWTKPFRGEKYKKNGGPKKDLKKFFISYNKV